MSIDKLNELLGQIKAEIDRYYQGLPMTVTRTVSDGAFCAWDRKVFIGNPPQDFSRMLGLNVKVNQNVPVGTAMFFKDGEPVAVMYNIGPPPSFPEPATDPWEEQG